MRTERNEPRLKMAEQLAAKLRARLRQKEFRPGDRLPTEQSLCHQYRVSRTVVREAIATLRADGLVIARQGSGVYVTMQQEPLFGFSLFAQPADKFSSIIEMLELRAAVESEAAALAAQRRSPAELAKMHECYDEISEALKRGELAEDQDFQFHLAIARATHNRHFVEFFEFLGQRTIPRAQINSDHLPRGGISSDERSSYLARIQQEHHKIVSAIADRDGTRAHSSMQAHLRASQERYQSMPSRVANS